MAECSLQICQTFENRDRIFRGPFPSLFDRPDELSGQRV